MTLKLGLRDSGVALVAAAIVALAAGVPSGLPLSALLAVGAVAVVGFALLGLAGYRDRPIKVGDVAVTTHRVPGQLARVKAVEGARASVEILGEIPPYDRPQGLVYPRRHVEEVPMASLRRRTAKEHIRQWLFSP